MENELLCNFPKCRKNLTSQAWVTSCSHVFCKEDGTREFGKGLVCPACKSALPGRYDAILTDLNPTEHYKSMILAGQKPDVVLDICMRAITFWTFQVHQEIMYQQYVSDKAKAQQNQLEQYYENVVQKAKNELEQVKTQLKLTRKQLETSQKRTTELTEKLNSRGRQYQKLQTLYDTLRRKFAMPAYFEKQASSELQNNHEVSFHVTSANDVIFPPNTERTRSGERHEAEANFVLRPVSTPVSSLGHDSFAFPSRATGRRHPT